MQLGTTGTLGADWMEIKRVIKHDEMAKSNVSHATIGSVLGWDGSTRKASVLPRAQKTTRSSFKLRLVEEQTLGSASCPLVLAGTGNNEAVRRRGDDAGSGPSS